MVRRQTRGKRHSPEFVEQALGKIGLRCFCACNMTNMDSLRSAVVSPPDIRIRPCRVANAISANWPYAVATQCARCCGDSAMIHIDLLSLADEPWDMLACVDWLFASVV